MDAPGGATSPLSWGNVALAFSFIVFDAVVSLGFGLGVGSGLVTAALRCIAQLSVVALVLQQVFETNNPWAVAGIACECPAAPLSKSRLLRPRSFDQSY